MLIAAAIGLICAFSHEANAQRKIQGSVRRADNSEHWIRKLRDRDEPRDQERDREIIGNLFNSLG